MFATKTKCSKSIMSRFVTRSARWLAVIAILATMAGMRTTSEALALTIDSFSANQSTLTLTYPPAGTSASSSASGAGILGGERDMEINLTAGIIAGNSMSTAVSSGFLSYSQDATIAGTGRIEWDGADGSATLDPTGLGGLDLTVGGSQDAFRLGVTFDDLPINIVIEVFSDAGNASSVTIPAPGLLFSTTDFIVPYSAFAPSLGSGANFASVGAITLTMGSNVTAPDLVLDRFETASVLDASNTVTIFNDVNSDTNADSGDTLRYTVVLTNTDDKFDASATGVSFSSGSPANTALVIGSVTTTQGTVTTGNTSGDTSVAVDVGTISDGAAVTITFDVLIDTPLPVGVTQVSCQGTVTSDTLSNLLTDDPGVGGTNDPTVIPAISSPTLVELLFFRTSPFRGGILTEWETASEIDNAGFHVWRSGKKNGKYVRITDSLIPAEGSSMAGAAYSFEITGGKPGKCYYYKLEDIDTSGVSTFHGPVKARKRQCDVPKRAISHDTRISMEESIH